MEIINGDITKVATSGYILHQVNCLSAMGAGVALSISNKWPVVRFEYLKFSKNIEKPKYLLGQMQYVKVERDLIVINSFTQLYYGNSYYDNETYTNEDLLIKNIKIASDKAKLNNKKLFIPYLIGCGLAGGNWNNIFKNIKDIDNLIIVKYNK